MNKKTKNQKINNVYDKILNFLAKTLAPIKKFKYLKGIAIFAIIAIIASFYNKFFMKKINHFDNNYHESNMEVISTESIFLEENETFLINNEEVKESIKVDEASKKVEGELKENFKGNFYNSRFVERINKRTMDRRKETLRNFEDDFYFGSARAPITIIEYSSYLCSHCLSFHRNVMNNLKSEYIDTNKVRYIKRIMAQPNTLVAVMLPYCAKPENRYNLVEDLYRNINKWNVTSNRQKNALREIALNNGFTEEQFEQCVKDKNLARKITERQENDIKDLNILSTPTFFINGEKSRGSIPYYDLKEKIEKELKRIEDSMKNTSND